MPSPYILDKLLKDTSSLELVKHTVASKKSMKLGVNQVTLFRICERKNKVQYSPKKSYIHDL